MNFPKIEERKILLMAIGNTARGDDGLGWRLGEMIADLDMDGINVEFRYQLQVEDAQLISQYDAVIFMDATEEYVEKGFWFSRCLPGNNYYYSSHKQSPEALLYLSGELYGKWPDAWILAIGGSDWELGENLSELAQANLQTAFYQLKNTLARATSLASELTHHKSKVFSINPNHLVT